MIRKPKFKSGFKYALGELMLIFLGISLAIAFQNWNDERKLKRQTTEILTEIKENLELDISSLENLLANRTLDLAATQRVIQLYSEKKPFDEGVSNDLGRVIIGDAIYFRKLGYGLLKESNLMSMTNPALRKMLNGYYEEYMQFVINDVEDDKFEFVTVLLPYVRNNFDEYGYRQPSIPRDYDLLLKDKYFLTSLKLNSDNIQSTIGVIENALSNAKPLLRAIEEEIEN